MNGLPEETSLEKPGSDLWKKKNEISNSLTFRRGSACERNADVGGSTSFSVSPCKDYSTVPEKTNWTIYFGRLENN